MSFYSILELCVCGGGGNIHDITNGNSGVQNE